MSRRSALSATPDESHVESPRSRTESWLSGFNRERPNNSFDRAPTADFEDGFFGGEVIMGIAQELPGSWESEEVSLVGFTVYALLDLNRDGSAALRIRFKSRIMQAGWSMLKIKYTGTWGATSKDDTMHLGFTGITTYPTQLLDQLLKSFKVHLSSDEFVSTIFGAMFELMGVGSSNGDTRIQIINENKFRTEARESTTFYRRV